MRDPCYTRHDVHVRMLALFSPFIRKGPAGAAEVSYLAFLLFLQRLFLKLNYD